MMLKAYILIPVHRLSDWNVVSNMISLSQKIKKKNTFMTNAHSVAKLWIW